jgi:hypothetical protein
MMSAPMRDDDQAVRVAARMRRAEQGAVTEMARLLLRDAREAAGAEAQSGRGAARQAGARVRLGRSGTPRRVRQRPLAARSA